MVNPIQELIINANSFGAQLDISFKLPEELPGDWKFFLFKRSGTDVTPEEIQSYFDNINNLSSYNYNGLFVFDSINNDDISLTGPTILPDLTVINGTTYYYKAVIRDQQTEEISAAVSANGTPTAAIRTSIVDGKDAVTQVLRKLFTNLVDENGNKVNLNKDIKIIKNFSLSKVEQNYLMVERINGSNNQQFWGMLHAQYENNVMLGEVDIDVIRVTFITYDSNDRRDKMTNIFRAYKPFIRQKLMEIGNNDIINAQITVEGDYFNPIAHSDEQHKGVTVIIALAIQNIMKLERTTVTSHEFTKGVTRDV